MKSHGGSPVRSDHPEIMLAWIRLRTIEHEAAQQRLAGLHRAARPRGRSPLTTLRQWVRLIGSPMGILRLLAVIAISGGPLLLMAATHPMPVYSVTAVQAGLTRSPGLWVGRTVRVRGVVADSCVTWMGGAIPACISWRPALLDASATSTALPLPLHGAPQPSLLAALGRISPAKWLLPSPQQIQWGALTTYRVRLLAVPGDACGTQRCYEALLLDAAPGSQF